MELKTCPFCGGKAHVFGGAGIYSIRCSNCGITNEKMILGCIQFSAYDSKEEAVEAWNNRVACDA